MVGPAGRECDLGHLSTREEIVCGGSIRRWVPRECGSRSSESRWPMVVASALGLRATERVLNIR